MNIAKHEEDIMYTETGGLIFNPYNEQNVEITLSEVQSILQRYGVPTPTIFNVDLYKRAFIHKLITHTNTYTYTHTYIHTYVHTYTHT